MSGPSDLLAQRYRLRRLLGTGGMGAVWEAFDEQLHRTVAVKQLHPRPWLDDAERDEATSRAMREARITARLDHPNAVPVYDVVEDDGMPCLVMKFIVAEPLSTVLDRRHALSGAEVAGLGAQVASALQAAHEVGIVHRDVKPGNILMAADGTARITDFGIAHAMGDVTLTSTGLVTGTPAYLAPEVARGERSGFPSDVFSLGATLYTAVEGRPPFGANANRMALLHRVASGAFIPPVRSGELTPLLTGMLAVNPHDRPVMSEVAGRLAAMSETPAAPAESMSTQTGTSTETTSPARTVGLPVRPGGAAVLAATEIVPVGPAPPSPREPTLEPGVAPERRRHRLVLAGGLVLVLLVLLGLALRPDSAPQTATPSTSRTSTRPASTRAASATASGTPTPSATTTIARTPSSPTASPSPAASTGTGVRATGPATAAQLTRAITSYYDLLPGGTDRAWTLMTADYQSKHAGGRTSYQQFWDQFSHVTTSQVRAVGSSTVEATVTYTTTSGRVLRERTSYGLVKDAGVLKINSSRVLASQ